MSQPGCKKSGRREFIQRSCVAVASVSVFGAACSLPDEAEGRGKKRPPSQRKKVIPTVVSRSDAKVFQAHGHDQKRVGELVNRAVSSLVGSRDYRQAFRVLFNPDDVVAIKLNCLAGPGMSSSVSVVNGLVAGLRAIGIEYRNIILWERSSAELARAGFTVNRSQGYRPLCYGNDHGGFERRIVFSGDVGSLWTNVLARRATALINVPVLKDHDLSGVGCGMKNMYGAIHNPNRYHENNCDPFVAQVSAHPYVRDKLRLVIADALTAQYQGGPARVQAHQWRPGTILAAADPVALDTVAGELIDAQRAKHGMASLEEAKRPPKWLKTAKKMGLGENDPQKIPFDRG